MNSAAENSLSLAVAKWLPPRCSSVSRQCRAVGLDFPEESQITSESGTNHS